MSYLIKLLIENEMAMHDREYHKFCVNSLS